jgi:AraC-like DNA-binding protein
VCSARAFAPAPDQTVAAAVRVLDRTGASVAGAAAHVHLSERALQRRFNDEVGYGPKTLQRVLRFQRFLRVAPGVGLARAAALAGYADQAHLTREATRLAGLTPRQLQTFQH